MRKGITVAGYCRVSTAGQDEEEKTSLQTQRKAIANFAKAYGWHVGTVYEDIESGYKEKRTNYQRMKDDAKAGRFSKIIFLDWTRFGRNARETLNAHAEFKTLSVSLVCIHGNVDTASAEGELFMTQMAYWQMFRRLPKRPVSATMWL